MALRILSISGLLPICELAASNSSFQLLTNFNYPHKTAEKHLIPDEVDSAAVREILLAFEEIYRAPLVLFYLNQLSYREIAETLGIPVGTVMSRISRGKARLRRCLSQFQTGCPTRKVIPMSHGNKSAK